MSVLIEIIIAAFISVIMSTEEVKNGNLENIDAQEQVAEISISKKCE